MSFLFDDVFPHIADRHIYECLKIIWEMTYGLRDDASLERMLPNDKLDKDDRSLLTRIANSNTRR
jgi:hypothetical protein